MMARCTNYQPQRLTFHLMILVFCIGCHGKTDLSKYFRSCARDSPELTDCLTAAVQEGVVAMAAGIPEVGLPPIDPHVQKEIKVAYNANQIHAKMQMKNIVSTGLKNIKIIGTRARINDYRFSLEIDVKQPMVEVHGDYRGEGRYNSWHVNTRGQFNSTMRRLKYTWKLEGKQEQRNNVTYCRITDFQMRPDVGEMQVYASNVFPDNPQLTQLANDISNQNWRIIYQELLPYAQDNWGKIGTNIANKLFLKVPYEELFPSPSSS